MSYDFTKITPIPTSMDFVNFTLHKTQRKTPTVIHRNIQISRIRKFYMRKVKYTQQSFHDRIKTIVTEFPQISAMHPFYGNLFNTIYDVEHYKTALGQLNHAMGLIDRVATDYVKLLKYGDSFYRCKQLKRAALGRMATITKKQANPLKYLEDVRQHMSRLPNIDPNDRTIILAGCPNAGKSSFMNLITNADVEVQPYPFTTKSLYIGHTDYDYLKWQVIDTPGILDRPVDEMNTIEHRAIAALGYLEATIIFFVDVSESCCYSIEQQMNIYESIKPIFKKNPVIIACSKKDILSLDELAEKSPDNRAIIKALEDEGLPVMEVSTDGKSGVMEIKSKACDLLLALRVDEKLRKKKYDSILCRINVAMPDNPTERGSTIPEAWVKKRKTEEMEKDDMETDEPPKKKLEIDLENELMEDYILDLHKNKLLANDDWKYDKIPIYYNGFNVSDFVDKNICQKLELLESEEKLREDAGVYDIQPQPLTEVENALLDTAKKITKILKIKRFCRRLDHGNQYRTRINRVEKAPRSMSTSRLRRSFALRGFDMTKTNDAHFTRADRSSSKKRRLEARSPSASMKTPRDRSGVRDGEMLLNIKKKEIKQRRNLRKKGAITESDRKIVDLMPKHLFAGKRGIGKNQRR